MNIVEKSISRIFHYKKQLALTKNTRGGVNQ